MISDASAAKTLTHFSAAAQAWLQREGAKS